MRSFILIFLLLFFTESVNSSNVVLEYFKEESDQSTLKHRLQELNFDTPYVSTNNLRQPASYLEEYWEYYFALPNDSDLKNKTLFFTLSTQHLTFGCGYVIPQEEKNSVSVALYLGQTFVNLFGANDIAKHMMRAIFNLLAADAEVAKTSIFLKTSSFQTSPGFHRDLAKNHRQFLTLLYSDISEVRFFEDICLVEIPNQK